MWTGAAKCITEPANFEHFIAFVEEINTWSFDLMYFIWYLNSKYTFERLYIYLFICDKKDDTRKERKLLHLAHTEQRNLAHVWYLQVAHTNVF